MTRIVTVSLFCAAILGGIVLTALTPRIGEVEASEGPAARCQQIEVSVDEGYGISAIETRQVCPRG